MPLDSALVEVGIDFWHRRGWSGDFHNAFYLNVVPQLRPAGGRFDRDWWDGIWPTLRAWSATRHGGTRAAMTQRAEQEFPALERLWLEKVSPRLCDDLSVVPWDEVSEFTSHVSSIKDVRSPVFTSKLCHFLIPQVFPVVDNWAMGNPYTTYCEYYQAAQSMWCETDVQTKQALVARLAALIGPAVGPEFPMACKLVELHLIGKRNCPTSASS